MLCHVLFLPTLTFLAPCALQVPQIDLKTSGSWLTAFAFGFTTLVLTTGYTAVVTSAPHATLKPQHRKPWLTLASVSVYDV